MNIDQFLSSIKKDSREVISEVEITRADLLKKLGVSEPVKTKGNGYKFVNPKGADLWFSADDIVKIISAEMLVIQHLAAREGVDGSTEMFLVKAL
jgi:hypothetical protein